MYFDAKGNLIACADMDNQLWSFDIEGHSKILITDYRGKMMNGPNDDSTLNQPNGLVGTPDDKYLYVAEAKANRILRYDIQPDGLLTNRQVFADMGSDGMTIDDRKRA